MKLRNSRPRLLLAAGLISLAASVSATAASYTWGGGNLLYTDTSASGWNGGLPLNGDTGTINSGQVDFANHDSFGNAGTTTSAILNLNGGTLASNGYFTTIWNLNLNGGTLLANGGANGSYPAFQLAGTVTVGGSQVSTIDATTAINANNQINIGGNGNSTLEFNVADVTANASSDLVINATLQNNPVSGAGSLTKSGAGTLLLTGTNTYSGATTVNAGILTFGNTAARSAGTTVTTAAAGTVGLGVGGAGYYSDGDVAALFNTNTLTGFNLDAASGVAIDTTAGDFTQTSALTGSRALTKLGSNTLTLSNNGSSFTGDLTINGGTILSTVQSPGTTSTLGATNVARTISVNSGGTLQFNSHDTFGNDATTTLVGVVINADGLVKNNNTYTTLPSLTLNGGELRADGGANDFGYGAYQLRSVTVGGSSASQITTNGGANSLISLGQTGGDIVTFNVADATGNAAADLSIAAVLRNSALGASGLTKSGAGTMTLSGANIYTGATLISSGTLVVNGNQTSATGSVSVNGTLAGNGGTIGGNTTINSGGKLAMGDGTANSIGSETFTGTLAFTATSIFEWDLNAPNTDQAGANQGSYDQVINNNGTAMSGTSVFNVVLGTGDSFGDAFWDTNKTWTNVFSGTGLATDLSAIFTSFSGSGIVDTVGVGVVAGQGSFSFNGSTALTWTAVPEPTSALAGLLITAGLLRRRRAVGSC